MSETLTIAIVGAVIGLATAVLGLIPVYIKRDSAVSEAWKPLSEAHQQLSDDLREENRGLRDRIDAVEIKFTKKNNELQNEVSKFMQKNEELQHEVEEGNKRIMVLEHWIELLIKQLEENGIKPVPKPKE